MRNKFMGAIYGSIIGDIIGSFNEFCYKGSRKPLRKLTAKVLHKERSVFGYKFGYFTDDTTMSLILMDHLAKENRHKDAIMLDYSRWINEGYMSSAEHCFDIGGQTYRSICEYFNVPVDIVYKDARGDGNGALMRIFPIALRYHNNDFMRTLATIEANDHTHSNSSISRNLCTLFTDAVAMALNGGTKEQILTCLGYNDDFDLNVKTTGYVLDTFKAVVHTFNKFDNLMDGVYYLANKGDDSDTAAAIYGALAGAFYGIDEIPEWMLNQLRRKKKIEELSENLYAFTMSRKGS